MIECKIYEIEEYAVSQEWIKENESLSPMVMNTLSIIFDCDKSNIYQHVKRGSHILEFNDGRIILRHLGDLN